MRLSNLILIFSFSFVTSITVQAQDWEAGFGIGVQAYRGDVSASAPSMLKMLRPTANIFGRNHFSDNWSVRGLVGFGKLYGDEKRFGESPTKVARGISFQSSIVEIGVMPEWRPLRVGNFELYLFSGMSIIHFNPKVDFNEKDNGVNSNYVALDKAIELPKTSLAVPIGGGIQWLPSSGFSIALELSGRATSTDYIDGISIAANPNSNDHHIITTLTLSKFFGGGRSGGSGGGMGRSSKVGCPTF